MGIETCSPNDTLEERFYRRIKEADPAICWLWPGALAGGHSEETRYGALTFHGKQLYAHRVSWELANGPIPHGMFVCHHCDNPRCVNPNHLFLGSARDNNNDMREKGRWTYGKNAVTRRHISAIRKRYASGERVESIAQAFALSVSGVRMIVYGHAWAGTLEDDYIASLPLLRRGPKLSGQEAATIMARLRSGETGESLALEYGVDRAIISRIRNGKIWVAAIAASDERDM